MILKKEQELYAFTHLEKTLRNHQLTGSLIICAVPIVAYTFFTETITQLLQKNPYIKLQILECSSKEALNCLLDNKCDMAFFFADSNELVKCGLDETLILRRLLTEKLYIVGSSSFNLSNNKSFSFSNTKKIPFATGYLDVTENIIEHYTLSSADVNSVLNTCNFDLILKLIANGTVVSSLLNSTLPYLPQNVDIDIIPSINPDKIDIYCAYRKADEKNDLIQAFIFELMTQF